MNILLLLVFVITIVIGDELFGHGDHDSLKEAMVDFRSFGRKTVRELFPNEASSGDQNDSRHSSEKHRSFSSIFFNLGSSRKESLASSFGNDDSREPKLIETPKLASQRFSIRPAISGRSFSAELREDQNSNEVSFEVTEVSVVSQTPELNGDSAEIASVLNNGSLLVTTSLEIPDKESKEIIENLFSENKNSIEPQQFFVRKVENGKIFVDLLKNSREPESIQISETNFTAASTLPLDTQTRAEKSRKFFVRPLENGRNFGNQHFNAFLSSDEDSSETKLKLILTETNENSAKPRKFFVRPLEDGKNFGTELNITKNQHQNSFSSPNEDFLEVTTLARDLPNERTNIINTPDFFIKPVANAKHFLPQQNEKKNTNLFQISIEDDSLEIVGRFSGGQITPTMSAAKFPEYKIKPLENGRLFTTGLDDNQKSNSEVSISTPANFVTSFQLKPTSAQNSRDFKISYPQKAVTKFEQTPETFQFSGYPSPKICLEGEVIGLDGRCTFPEIIKNIYIYQKPIKEYVSEELLNPPKPKVKINLVVIRSDGSSNRGDPIIIPPPQEKTVVLVLDKEDESGRKVIEVTPPPSGEPEVYFVDYKDGENPLLPGGIDLQEALGSAILSQQTYEVPQSSNAKQQLYQVPQQQYQAPRQQYQAPSQQYQALQLNYEAPQQLYNLSQQKLKEPQTPQGPPTPKVNSKEPISTLFINVEQSSSSKEDDLSEFNSRVLLSSPTRLLDLRQDSANARRSRATGGRSINRWGRMRTGNSKRLKPILPPRSNN